MSAKFGDLVSAGQLLAACREDSDQLFIFDASYFLPGMGRMAHDEYLAARLPGAVFFDIDAIGDPASDLPHMVPDTSLFQEMMRGLGLSSDHQVVVYDNSPFLSAARAWWLLQLFGHQKVALLDGGLAGWRDVGGAVETGPPKARPAGDFIARPPRRGAVILFDDICQMDKTQVQLVDARSAGRFQGTAAEPRPGLRSGHIPGARNLPVTELLDQATGKLKDLNGIASLFQAAGVDLDRPIVTSCGSGVTAAGLTFGLALLGRRDIGLYDGSWSEYGASDAPVATGRHGLEETPQDS